MSRRFIGGRMAEVPDPNTAAVIAATRGETQPTERSPDMPANPLAAAASALAAWDNSQALQQEDPGSTRALEAEAAAALDMYDVLTALTAGPVDGLMAAIAALCPSPDFDDIASRVGALRDWAHTGDPEDLADLDPADRAIVEAGIAAVTPDQEGGAR
jgi:hypothetical protein